jgi:hypothetical protein
VNDGFLVAIEGKRKFSQWGEIISFNHLAAIIDPNPTEYSSRSAVKRFEDDVVNRSPLTICWYQCVKVFALYLLESYQEALTVGEQNKKVKQKKLEEEVWRFNGYF